MEHHENGSGDSAEHSLDQELEEFCETSSWETSSVKSQDAAGNTLNANKERGYDSRDDSQSEDSVASEKLAQDKWEDNECEKFHQKWHLLQREIDEIEEKILTMPANAPATVKEKATLNQK